LRVFVSGPMSGHDNYNFDAFARAENQLRDHGDDVISGRMLFASEIARGITRPHKDYLRMSIKLMLSFETDTICLLEGWQESDGSRAEVAVGLSLGMDFIDEFGNPMFPEYVEIWASERWEDA
jgi:hypothetical protein